MNSTKPESLGQVRILGPEELAALLHRNVATLKVDSRRKPESLPPRLEIPNCKRLLWLESDVMSWLEGLRTPIRRRARF